MSEIKYGRYGIIWILDGYGLSLGSRSAKVSIGICRATNEVAFFGIGQTPSVMKSIHIDNCGCKEGDKCLYSNCPLNRTTWDSYKAGSEFGSGVKSLQGYTGLVALRNEVQLSLLRVEDMGDWIDRERDVAQGYTVKVEKPVFVAGSKN